MYLFGMYVYVPTSICLLTIVFVYKVIYVTFRFMLINVMLRVIFE